MEPYFALIEHVIKKQTMKNLQKIKQQISNKTSSILRKFQKQDQLEFHGVSYKT